MLISRRRDRSGWLGTVLAAALVSSVAGQVANPHAGEPIGTVQQVYDGTLLPDVQVNTFRNIDRLFPTRTVRRGPTVYPLPIADRALRNVQFTSDGATYDLYDYMSLNRVSGLLVIKNGRIALESYQLGNHEGTRWMSMSVVKSITGSLIGAAIQEGRIRSVDDAITRYLPRLSGSSYEGVTVRHLLQMASGVGWDETYTNPQSDRRRMLELQVAQRPGGILALMASLPRVAAPGTRWNYSTGETHVAGALLRAAVGRPLAEYLSERLWARFGMESDATWWLEAPDGLEVGGSGLSATLRDYGRFGLFLLDGGRAGGVQVLPDGWVEEAGSATIIGGMPIDYGYMLWPISNAAGTVHEDAFEAVGIFGQHLYVNAREALVIVVWGAQPKPTGRAVVSTDDFFAAVAQALR